MSEIEVCRAKIVYNLQAIEVRAYDTPNETWFILNQQVCRHGNATRDSVAEILT